MLDRKTFQNQDLILRVSENVDPRVFDVTRYEAFLDALCGMREYQKEATRATLRYLLGRQYKNLRELAEENFHQNAKLQEKYATFADFEKNLQLPDKLYCALDLATATGKSYVIYGIARIMLAEGAVDRVLVLCPSNTIEKGLTEKFRDLSGDGDLLRLLPSEAEIKNPGVINASETIKRGDICIENIHATYEHVKSAVEDSLKERGEKTLVLNDEVHHMTSVSAAEANKWKGFLQNPDYGFKYVVGVSGTCYRRDDYFAEVIYRYSLRQAIEEKFVKTIDYVAEDTSGDEYEKFQKIYDNHVQNKNAKYRKVKPLTIIVTRDISACERLTDKWIEFLAEKKGISRDDTAKKVLIVTSSPKHKENVMKLAHVDEKGNPTEWITSVSMLSEGWDVQNVFQIVPHEERAFNSKLLIAQVLGRGLRIPSEYKGEQPVVRVFNHDKWSGSIRHLVNEVLEIEKRLGSYPIPKEEDYNFELYNIDYKKTEEAVEVPRVDEYELLKKEHISYSSQEVGVEKETVYERAISEDRERKVTYVTYKMHPVEEVAQDVWNKLRVFDLEEGTSYAQKFTKEKISEIIRKSLRKVGEKEDRVSEENRQKTLQAFGVVKRKRTKALRFKIEEMNLEKVETSKMRKDSLGVGALRRDATVFYDEYSLDASDDQDVAILYALKADDDLRRGALFEVTNKFCFKTPVNVAFASYKPEQEFMKRLVSENNARTIDAWIKSPDTGFYHIDYSWRKGEHPKQGRFNPDFFIIVGDDILVVEVKMDGDVSDENEAKLKHARKHFERVNHLQKKQHYYFKFLSPHDYDLFFHELRAGKHRDFKGKLEADLE